MPCAEKTQDPCECVGRPVGWRGTVFANKPLKKLKSSNRRYAHSRVLAGKESYLICTLQVSWALLEPKLLMIILANGQLKAAKRARFAVLHMLQA